MGNADEIHFETYRDQTKLKHEILRGYLPAYFDIPKGHHTNLVYVDGFAGRGHYKEGVTSRPGSPILAMQLFAESEDHRSQVQCFFIEADENYFAALEGAVKAQQKAAPLAKNPFVVDGPFSDFMKQLKSHLAKGTPLAPTFLFVDPCGVDGVRLDDLVEVLKRKYCELFLFFNYEGVNRIAGYAEKHGNSPTLVELFGTKRRVGELIEQLKAASNPEQREEVIVSLFCSALRQEAGAEYLLPFRIEHASKEKTSHYLLHATKHPHGFRVMKYVMGKAAKERGGTSCLELLQASSKDGPHLFEHPDATSMKSSILRELAKDDSQVSLFRKEWVIRPTDMFSEEDYKIAILELEAAGKLLVFDKNNEEPKPAAKRQRMNKATGISQTTLGEDLWLRKR